MPIIKYFFLSILLFFQVISAFCQVTLIDTAQVMSQLPSLGEAKILLDSLEKHPELQELLPDSIKNKISQSVNQSAIQSDSLSDTTKAVPKKKIRSDVETTINYKATDSIFFDLNSQNMYLYGNTKVEYGNIALTGAQIKVDWVGNSLQAIHVKDSTGRKVGKPVFNEGGDAYETDDMIYNFKSRKAVINGIITKQDGAIMHGERVKKNEFDELFIRDAKYTTCDLEHPHFYIKAKKLKVIPNNKVVSGPFNLYFGEIPTPIGFAFGMFPQPKKRASGIIFPSYGEDRTRGFFLNNGGYYFDINDYLDLKLTGQIYSKGSYGLQGSTTYKVRYKFGGSMNVRYNKTVDPSIDKSGPDSKDFWINWSHTPESFGTSRLSGSASMGTSSFTQNNNNLNAGYAANVNTQFNSSLNYSKTFKGTPFNLTVSGRHSQNIRTEVVNVTLPELSFNANRIMPFKNVPKLKNGVLGKLGFSYKLAAKADLSNSPKSTLSGIEVINRNPKDDSLVGFSSDNLAILLDRAQLGARHQIPISTSFNVMKNFTVSPSFNYTEVWYPKELKFSYDSNLEGVRVDTVRQFSRAGWYNGGASVTTRMYGFYPIGGRKIQAIRHVITPSVGLSLSPDFADPSKGNFTRVQINEKGQTKSFSKFEGFAYSGPTAGKSATMSFSLSNNLEMKVKTKNDSIDTYEKIKLFDNLAISSGYNFLADSFRLSTINMNARTSFFKNAMYISLSGTLDPYVNVLDSIYYRNGKKTVVDHQVDRYTWDHGMGLGQLSRGNIAIGLNLKPKSTSKKDKNTDNPNSQVANNIMNDPNQLNDPNQNVAGNVNKFFATDPNQYVPWDVPWAFNVNYSFNYSKSGFSDPVITQTLNFNGNVSITETTKVNMSSGYDIKQKEFTFTQMSVAKSLHCWNISFNWVPFGLRQSYYVSIQVNSALLKDLKLDKRAQPIYQAF